MNFNEWFENRMTVIKEPTHIEEYHEMIRDICSARFEVYIKDNL